MLFERKRPFHIECMVFQDLDFTLVQKQNTFNRKYPFGRIERISFFKKLFLFFIENKI